MATEITTEQLRALQNSVVPFLPESGRVNFENQTFNYQLAQSLLNNIGYVRDAWERESLTLKKGQAAVLQNMDQDINNARSQVARISDGDQPYAGIVKDTLGRIRQSLGDPKTDLHLILRPLRVFGLPEHPSVAPLLDRRSVLKQEINQTNTQYKLQRDDDERFIGSVEGQTQLEASGCQNCLIRICEYHVARGRKDLVFTYARILPNRAIDVVNAYSKLGSHQDIEDLFPQFMDFILTNSNKDPRVVKRMRAEYGQAYEDVKKAPTLEEFRKLPESVKEKYRAFAAYELGIQMELADIIDKAPGKPQVLIKI